MHPFVAAQLDELKKGHFPKDYRIDLSYRALGDNEIEALAQVLNAPQNGETVTYNLSHNTFTAAGIDTLCHTLTTLTFSSPLVFDLSHNQLNDEALRCLAHALASGHFPPLITFKLGYNRFSADGAQFIAAALATGHCPTDLTLDFEGNRAFSEAAASHFAQSLESKRWPNRLTLSLKSTDMKDAGMTQVAEKLACGPEQLTLNVSFNGLTSKSMDTLAKTLPFAPNDLTLNLSSNSIRDGGVIVLAASFQANGYPLRQTLILDFNGLTDAGAQSLAATLTQARLEHRLSLSLAGNNLTSHSTTAFWHMLRRESCPPLALNFKNNQLALLSVKTLAITLSSAKIANGTVINLAKNKLKDSDLAALWPALTSETCPARLTLNFSENGLTGDTLKSLLESIEQFPTGLTLDLSNNRFSEEDKKALLDGLRKKWLPVGCRILLSNSPESPEQIELNQLTQASFQNALAFLTVLQGHAQDHVLSRLPVEIISTIFSDCVPHENPASVSKLHRLATHQLLGIYRKREQNKSGFFLTPKNTEPTGDGLVRSASLQLT
ncbi:hypothetical protein DIZ81_04975 [Legionella taurinensis]|uniref:Uncharacterized protein n=1 Tax=Legionella taurinensis TaxID=70611 RepID=A0AB38N831_9GAMM|nr:hypothetical protein [Legionella taurinensis]MDX1837027.1 hypothetical protein [Legionella taurinensis]PUT41431.1 hypothetical protein DB744_04975 [Legionella taurinensis]PUT42670.1 hypothetical protein DB746_07310 [Legionella taurinensis]PUT46698.1 hypothetical protein DB743_04710 [Legionella taurinensis]PUT47347.1 hypothetical protein DB745_08390 [Legionella taurinensis]